MQTPQREDWGIQGQAPPLWNLGEQTGAPPGVICSLLPLVLSELHRLLEVYEKKKKTQRPVRLDGQVVHVCVLVRARVCFINLS